MSHPSELSQTPLEESVCYHCTLPNPNNVQYFVTILGVARPICCPGCEAIASNLIELGIETYSKHRTMSDTEKPAGAIMPNFLKQNAK